MAEESAEEGAPAESKPPKKPLNLGLILGVLNTVALMGVLGFLVYTRILYKRPALNENREREKIANEVESRENEGPVVKSMLKLDPIQANLKPTQIGAKIQGGPPPQLRPHFLTMTIALELNDASLEPLVKAQVPKFLDQLLQSLGNTTVEELSTVQGRYILRSRIIGIMNDLVKKNQAIDIPVISNVYFADFTVQ